MADVKVKTIELELRTVKLTKSILKQIPHLDYDEMKPLLKSDGNEKSEHVIGWIHGSVLSEDYDTWVLFKTGEGTYGLFSMMMQARKRYPQIYIV